MGVEQSEVRVVSPHFKYSFLGVIGLTLLALGISLWLSIAYSHPDSNINGLIVTTDSMYKFGFGGIIGLLGGRTA